MASDRAGVASRVSRALLVTLLVASVASAGPIPLDRSLGSVDQTVAETTTPRLVVEEHTVGYEGSDIGSITIYVNNSGSELIGEVRVVLTAKNGTVMGSETKSSIVLAPGRNEIPIDLSATYDPRRVSRIRLVAGASL